MTSCWGNWILSRTDIRLPLLAEGHRLLHCLSGSRRMVQTIYSLQWLKLSLYVGSQLFMQNFCPALA